MKKSLLLFVFVSFTSFLISSTLFAQTPQPTGQTTYYYCIGDSAGPLTAGGTNLVWYTSLTDLTGSSIAPTPSTSIATSTIYYVTQTIGGVESSRKGITVNVVADNGATILNFRCDNSQIAVADRFSSVFF